MPMSDGGPGFVDVLHAALGGELLSVTVIDQYGDETPAAVLMVEDTAYVEAAQACGLHLSERREPERATTYGVGQLVAAAIDDGARTVVRRSGRHGDQRRWRGPSRRTWAPPPIRPRRWWAAPHALELLTSRSTWRRARALRRDRPRDRLRRRQPAARSARRDERLRPAEGGRR